MSGWLKSAALAGVALAVALAAGELGLRIAGVGTSSFWVVDPLRGAAHRPNAEGWYEKEGRSFSRINSAGMRDREHAREKPPGTFRFAVLGDSYAEAMQVDAEQAFWAVAERELRSCPALGGRTPEALNFGVSGYGTAQEFETLRHLVWPFSPDVVVLAFLTGNDLRNNVRELEGDELRPYYVVRDGKLVLDDSFLQSRTYLRAQTWWWRAKDWAVLNLNLMQLVYAARDALVRTRLAPMQENAERPIYTPPADPLWAQAWDVTERMISAMRDETVAHGAAFQLMVLTNWRQVHPDPELRAREARDAGAEDLSYPDRRLETFARAQNIPFLALAEPLRTEAEETGTCLHGFENAVPCGGHWNERGHEVGGRFLAKHLCERAAAGELPTPAPSRRR